MASAKKIKRAFKKSGYVLETRDIEMHGNKGTLLSYAKRTAGQTDPDWCVSVLERGCAEHNGLYPETDVVAVYDRDENRLVTFGTRFCEATRQKNMFRDTVGPQESFFTVDQNRQKLYQESKDGFYASSALKNVLPVTLASITVNCEGALMTEATVVTDPLPADLWRQDGKPAQGPKAVRALRQVQAHAMRLIKGD